MNTFLKEVFACIILIRQSNTRKNGHLPAIRDFIILISLVVIVLICLGVGYLHKFLTTNKGKNPFGQELPLSEARPGDTIQLSFHGHAFTHSVFVLGLIMKKFGLLKIQLIILTAHFQPIYMKRYVY